MANPPHPLLLLVEGLEDQRVIPHLVEANGHRWGERNETPLVQIEQCDGVENMLAERFISNYLKRSGLQACGILVDADGDVQARWQAVRGRCLGSVPDLPRELPAEGAFGTSDLGVRVGIWIMPDNREPGMLETFLQGLRSDAQPALVAHAESACDAAHRDCAAPFSLAHRDKAIVHKWLAWQDPPGRQLHQAVIERVLDPRSAKAAPFLRWFRRLYALDPQEG